MSEPIAEMTAKWCANPYEIHKRPPFRAHLFDNDGRYWVVGTTRVSVLHGAHGSKEWAEEAASLLNDTPTVREFMAVLKGEG
jgi:hypothetical protein